MSIAQKMCKEKKYVNSNYVHCNNVSWSNICCQEFWSVLIDLEIWLEPSENENLASQKLFQVCKIWQFIINVQFLLVDWYKLVVSWLRWVAVCHCLATLVWFEHCALALLSLAILSGTEPVQVIGLTYVLLYCCSLHIIRSSKYVFLQTCQHQLCSDSDSVLILKH